MTTIPQDVLDIESALQQQASGLADIGIVDDLITGERSYIDPSGELISQEQHLEIYGDIEASGAEDSVYADTKQFLDDKRKPPEEPNDPGYAAYQVLKKMREDYPLGTAIGEIVAGVVPGVGQMIDMYDFADAAAAKPPNEMLMAMAVAGAIPIGGDLAKILKRPAVLKALGMHGKDAFPEVATQIAKAAQIGRGIPGAAKDEYEKQTKA